MADEPHDAQPDAVEELRRWYQARVARSSVRMVAKMAMLNHATLNTFVRGETRPTGDVLERMVEFRERERIQARLSADPPAAPLDTPSQSPAHELLPGYWIGVLDGIRQAHAEVGRQLAAFIARGVEWEANSVRDVALRAARAGQAMGAATGQPDLAPQAPDAAAAEAFWLAVQQTLARQQVIAREASPDAPSGTTPSTSGVPASTPTPTAPPRARATWGGAV